MLSYYDMPFADDDIDYAAQDEMIRQGRQWLREELPWVSTTEMQELTRQDDFPGFLADCDRLAAFVGKFKRGKARYVACKVQQRSFTVSARIDLVSGIVYLVDNGRHVQSNLHGTLFVEVAVPHTYYPNSSRAPKLRKFVAFVRNGRMDFMSATEMQDMVDALARARMLAPL
jgi:hypothetical protein